MRFKEIGEIFLKLGNKKDFKETFLDLIGTSNKDGNTTYYFLKKSSWDEELFLKYVKNFYYSNRMFNDVYVLRYIKARPKVKNLLLAGYELDVIPTNKKNAITLEAIKNKINRS